MKDKWIEKFKNSRKLAKGNYVEVLTGFNANIDSIYNFEEMNIDFTDIEPQIHENIDSLTELKETIIYCRDNDISTEVNGSQLNFELDGGNDSIGGQGGIMAKFLSNFNNSVTFYTPFLSKDLSRHLNKEILYPVIEDNKFVLKNVKDCVNTDRTKNNLIFEFSEGKSGRLIVSDNLKGFGPYFRKGIEDNIPEMDNNLDRIMLSGFHNVRGNMEAKLKKSEKQLEMFETPIHVEYVDVDNNIREKLEKYILPQVDSIGLDEYELKELSDQDIKGDASLGDAYQCAKNLIQEHGLSRVHIHTYRYHVTVVEEDYEVDSKKIRSSMLFGGLCAVQVGEYGFIPGESEIMDFTMENKYMRKLDELEDFADYLDLDHFVETGTAEIEDFRIIATPVIVHEDPKRTVGMGDLISSATFTSELK